MFGRRQVKRIVDNETRVPTVEGRERRWSLVRHGDEAVLIHYLVLQPGEHVDDSPPEERMPLEEWERRHAEFGLTVDGRPL